MNVNDRMIQFQDSYRGVRAGLYCGCCLLIQPGAAVPPILAVLYSCVHYSSGRRYLACHLEPCGGEDALAPHRPVPWSLAPSRRPVSNSVD